MRGGGGNGPGNPPGNPQPPPGGNPGPKDPKGPTLPPTGGLPPGGIALLGIALAATLAVLGLRGRLRPFL